MMRPARRSTLLYACVAVVLLTTLVRIAPLLEGGLRLQRQCISEDGYLMLTVARNLALGRGFSVSDGLIPSNGSQPLATLLYALCFICASGDKLLGLYPVVGLQIVVSILAAAILFVYVRKHLYRGHGATTVAILSACLWYASPTSVLHTQNGLETGLYVLLILMTLLLYDIATPRLRAGLCLRWCLALGVALGITFLARNDACLLVGATLATHLILGYRYNRLRQALVQAVLIGATSIAMASPWLWFNLTKFGHIVPISGRAEALNVEFASNLLPACVAVIENSLLVARIPGLVEHHAVTSAASVLLVLLGLIAACAWRHWLAARFTGGMAILACFVAALFAYYALFFGMPSFLGRYFFPITILCAVIASAVFSTVASATRDHPHRALVAVGAIAAAVLCCGSDLRIYLKGEEHLHSQVVDWVAANVPQDTWVAGVQTGTLGYYHDRTINLDGKVDPFALAARRDGRTHEYLFGRNVEYIVDWAGIAEWAQRPEFARDWRLILNDQDLNLAVFQLKASAKQSRRPEIPETIAE